MAPAEDVEVVRFYRVSRVPVMFGRWPTGERIPGGPYTALQFGVGAAVGGVMVSCWGFWARGNLLLSLVVLCAAVAGSTYLAGLARSVQGNPLSMGLGLWSVLVVARQGTCRGVAVRLVPPRRVCGQVAVDHRPPPAPRPAAGPDIAPPAAPVSPVPGVSAVQRLLAQTASR